MFETDTARARRYSEPPHDVEGGDFGFGGKYGSMLF
jgi:hypothetical protein